MAQWKKTVNQKDYKLWKKGKTGKFGTTVAVYRNVFTASNRNYYFKNQKQAMNRAKAYMDKRKK